MKSASLKIEDERYTLEAVIVKCGRDYSLSICGGTEYHIGAQAIGIPRDSLKMDGTSSASVSVFCVTGHKDDQLANEAAKYLAARINNVICVNVGIHIDDASSADIQRFLTNFQRLLPAILDLMVSMRG